MTYFNLTDKSLSGLTFTQALHIALSPFEGNTYMEKSEEEMEMYTGVGSHSLTLLDETDKYWVIADADCGMGSNAFRLSMIYKPKKWMLGDPLQLEQHLIDGSDEVLNSTFYQWLADHQSSLFTLFQ